MLCKHAMLIIWQLICNVSMSCFFHKSNFLGVSLGAAKTINTHYCK
jgi:hypothetical protein